MFAVRYAAGRYMSASPLAFVATAHKLPTTLASSSRLTHPSKGDRRGSDGRRPRRSGTVEAGLCMLSGVPVPIGCRSRAADRRRRGTSPVRRERPRFQLALRRIAMAVSAIAGRARTHHPALKDDRVAGMLHGRPDTNWRCVELSIGRFRDRRSSSNASPRTDPCPKPRNGQLAHADIVNWEREWPGAPRTGAPGDSPSGGSSPARPCGVAADDATRSGERAAVVRTRAVWTPRLCRGLLQ
jgi:hypothetical protein